MLYFFKIYVIFYFYLGVFVVLFFIVLFQKNIVLVRNVNSVVKLVVNFLVFKKGINVIFSNLRFIYNVNIVIEVNCEGVIDVLEE